jgi:hypothetical protein
MLLVAPAPLLCVGVGVCWLVPSQRPFASAGCGPGTLWRLAVWPLMCCSYLCTRWSMQRCSPRARHPAPCGLWHNVWNLVEHGQLLPVSTRFVEGPVLHWAGSYVNNSLLVRPCLRALCLWLLLWPCLRALCLWATRMDLAWALEWLPSRSQHNVTTLLCCLPTASIRSPAARTLMGVGCGDHCCLCWPGCWWKGVVGFFLNEVVRLYCSRGVGAYPVAACRAVVCGDTPWYGQGGWANPRAAGGPEPATVCCSRRGRWVQLVCHPVPQGGFCAVQPVCASHGSAAVYSTHMGGAPVITRPRHLVAHAPMAPEQLAQQSSVSCGKLPAVCKLGRVCIPELKQQTTAVARCDFAHSVLVACFTALHVPCWLGMAPCVVNSASRVLSMQGAPTVQLAIQTLQHDKTPGRWDLLGWAVAEQ